MPQFGGYLPASQSSVPPDEIVQQLTRGKYAYAYTTMLSYISTAFGGWRGSIRYAIDISNTSHKVPNNEFPAIDYGITIGRTPFANVENNITTLDDLQSVYLGNLLNAQINFDLDGKAGITRVATRVNPFQSFEVPYYSSYRFAPAKKFTKYGGRVIEPFQQGWAASIDTVDKSDWSAVWPIYAAAGEDFTAFFYLGPPRYYVQRGHPTA